MTKSLLRKSLNSSPRAKRHVAVIKSTLKALKALNAVGVGIEDTGYNLASPYSGRRKPEGAIRRKIPKVKMTYSA